jgi:hypothetical protein
MAEKKCPFACLMTAARAAAKTGTAAAVDAFPVLPAGLTRLSLAQ